MSSPEFKTFDEITGKQRVDAAHILYKNIPEMVSIPRIYYQLSTFESYVLVWEEKVIAVAGISSRGHNQAFLNVIAVEEHERRKGYGNKLLGFIENQLLENAGSEDVRIKTHPFASAVDFYEKQGYIKSESESNYYFKVLSQPGKGK